MIIQRMTTNAVPPLNGIAPLDHLGVIRVAGADAVSFLQGQLTNDFALLPSDEARLAGFLSAKGRMQASFIGWIPAPGEVLLVCHRSVLEAVRKRLSMFVMRAKAQLTDATADFSLLGVAGLALETLAGQVLPAWKKKVLGAAQLVFLPSAAGRPRALWLAPAGEAPPAGPALPADTWRWGEVASGVATLEAGVVDAFVPQMLNYESVGGVNFKKGCYPGQEVVARSQFRGTLKRRGYVVHADAPLAVGQEVFHSSDAEQPCGTVAQVAAAPGGGFEAIVSMQISAAQGGELHAGSADGALLALLPLPYALLDDI
jgi:folate-binding protein YgfZ